MYFPIYVMFLDIRFRISLGVSILSLSLYKFFMSLQNSNTLLDKSSEMQIY